MTAFSPQSHPPRLKKPCRQLSLAQLRDAQPDCVRANLPIAFAATGAPDLQAGGVLVITAPFKPPISINCPAEKETIPHAMPASGAFSTNVRRSAMEPANLPGRDPDPDVLRIPSSPQRGLGRRLIQLRLHNIHKWADRSIGQFSTYDQIRYFLNSRGAAILRAIDLHGANV